MANKIRFDLVSPERMLLSEDVDMVTLPGAEGDMGVLAGHAPVISTLRPGVIDVQGGSQADLRLYVRGGFAEIDAEKIIVLAEEAVPLKELDSGKLDARIKNAEEDFGAARSDEERARAQAALDHLRQLRAAL
jgi:F-type H+-transporting ATPase subunit epsilon